MLMKFWSVMKTKVKGGTQIPFHFSFAGTWPSSILCSSACHPQRPRWWCLWSGSWRCCWPSLNTTIPPRTSCPAGWSATSTGLSTPSVTSKRCECRCGVGEWREGGCLWQLKGRRDPIKGGLLLYGHGSYSTLNYLNSFNWVGIKWCRIKCVAGISLKIIQYNIMNEKIFHF